MPHQCTTCGHVFEDGSKDMLSGCPDCGGNKFQFRPGSVSQETADTGGTGADERSHAGEPSDTSAESEPPERPESNPSSVAETVGRATTKVRDFVSSDSPTPSTEPNPDAEWPGDWNSDSRETVSPDRSPADSPSDRSVDPDLSGGIGPGTDDRDDNIIDADARRRARGGDEQEEDVAQASARTDVVSPDELDGRTLDRADDSDSPSAPEGVSDDAPDAASDGTVVSEPTGEDPDLADLREQLNDQFESIKVLEPGQYELNLMELYDREEYIIALQENGRYVIQVPEQWMGEDPDDR